MNYLFYVCQKFKHMTKTKSNTKIKAHSVVGLPGGAKVVASPASNMDKLDEAIEKDLSKELNIEDVLKDFLFKKAHLFVMDYSYGGFVATLSIGVIKVSHLSKKMMFEHLEVNLSDEEVEQFLAARVKLQKEFLISL